MVERINSTERQLNLISTFLKAREPLTWDDIVEIEGFNDDAVLRTRQRRFERDIKALEETGLKIVRKYDGVRPFYELDRNTCMLPSMNLTPEQRLLMFRVGMAYLEGEGAGPLHNHLSSALLKLQAGAGRAGLPAEIPRTFVKRSLNRRPAETSALEKIGAALLDRRKVSFRYEGRGNMRTGKRNVAPYALVSRRGGWYLIAYDVDRRAERTFRLSRIRGQVSTGDRPNEYEIPADFDPERDFAAEVFGGGDSAFRNVHIRFDAEVAFVVENEFEGIYEIKKRKDGSITLVLPQAWPDELLRYLGEFPGHWKVEKPAALRELIVKRLKASLKAAKGGAK